MRRCFALGLAVATSVEGFLPAVRVNLTRKMRHLHAQAASAPTRTTSRRANFYSLRMWEENIVQLRPGCPIRRMSCFFWKPRQESLFESRPLDISCPHGHPPGLLEKSFSADTLTPPCSVLTVITRNKSCPRLYPSSLAGTLWSGDWVHTAQG